MAINSGYLARVSSIRRYGDISVPPPPVCVVIVPTVPPASYSMESGSRITNYNGFSRGERFQYVTYTNNPLFEGQVCVYYNQAAGTYPILYVVININGTLTWKRAMTVSSFIDMRTGLEYDPNLEFYSPLGS